MNKTVLIKKDEFIIKKTVAKRDNLVAYQEEKNIPSLGTAATIYNNKVSEYDKKFHPSLKKQRF